MKTIYISYEDGWVELPEKVSKIVAPTFCAEVDIRADGTGLARVTDERCDNVEISYVPVS